MSDPTFDDTSSAGCMEDVLGKVVDRVLLTMPTGVQFFLSATRSFSHQSWLDMFDFCRKSSLNSSFPVWEFVVVDRDSWPRSLAQFRGDIVSSSIVLTDETQRIVYVLDRNSARHQRDALVKSVHMAFSLNARASGGSVVHGGAVSIDGHSVCFLGNSGLGKSRLTVEFAKSDPRVQILSDDRLGVSENDDQLVVWPVSRRIRLGVGFDNEVGSLGFESLSVDKRNVDVEANSLSNILVNKREWLVPFKRFEPSIVPLDLIVLLRQTPPSRFPEIARMPATSYVSAVLAPYMMDDWEEPQWGDSAQLPRGNVVVMEAWIGREPAQAVDLIRTLWDEVKETVCLNAEQ